MGSISSGVQEKTCESPLKTRLRVLAKSISKLGYIGAFLASFAYLFMQIVVKNNFKQLKIYHLCLTIYFMF